MFKNHIQKKLEKYVQKYFQKHPEVKLVAVAGSVGKTSTKIAVATVLSYRYRVRMHDGNHNTSMSAPLAILGIEYPENIRSFWAWQRVFRQARQRIRRPTDVDVIIQELGSDRPGDLAIFARYLQPDIGVVTGVTPEHMEFFGSIEAVAQEELSLANFSKTALINKDDIDGRFADFLTNPSMDTYGTSGSAEYHIEISDFTVDDGYSGQIFAPEFPESIPAKIKVVGEHSLRPAMAAVAVAANLGMLPKDIADALATYRAVPGRMNILRGLQNSIIIDDTYNSSPAAAEAALRAIYSIEAPQHIVILGSMNELGATSEQAHRTLGELCDPDILSWVITIGEEAEKYTAPVARQRGCQVKSFHSAIDAGAFAHSVLDDGALVLVKGSQGSIFAEEAVKVLLHDTDDYHKLVRQSPAWTKTKQDFFSKFADN